MRCLRGCVGSGPKALGLPSCSLSPPPRAGPGLAGAQRDWLWLEMGNIKEAVSAYQCDGIKLHIGFVHSVLSNELWFSIGWGWGHKAEEQKHPTVLQSSQGHSPTALAQIPKTSSYFTALNTKVMASPFSYEKFKGIFQDCSYLRDGFKMNVCNWLKGNH